MLEVFIPARLKVLLGAVQTTIRSAYSGATFMIGMNVTPRRIRSQWISSQMIHLSYFLQISTVFLSSSSVQTRPVGLCGLHTTRTLFAGSAIFLSRSSKSIR